MNESAQCIKVRLGDLCFFTQYESITYVCVEEKKIEIEMSNFKERT